MTFQDLRSGCCSINSHTGNKEARENLPVAANDFFATILFDGTSHLYRNSIQSLTSPLGLAQN